MTTEGYDFGRERFAELLLRRFFPEKTDHESALLLAYLVAHGDDFDGWRFSVRIGEGLTPDPEHLPGVQANTARASRRRIDFVGMHNDQATLVEMKTRVGHQVMGQLLSDRQLWVDEFPNGPEPLLVAVGRSSTDEDLRILTGHGITVYLYDTPVTE